MLADGARSVCLVLALRALPFTVYTALSPRVALGRKAAAVALYAGIVALLAHWGSLATVGWIACGMAYYVVLGCGMNPLSRLLAERTVTRGAVFVLLAGLCLLVPGVVLPGIASTTFLVVGWELLLSGYSYCVETSRKPTPPALADCLFFLLVNPTVAWTRRGSPLPDRTTEARGMLRAAAGMLVVLLNAAFLKPLCRQVGESGLAWLPVQLTALGVVLVGALRILSEYAAHSGLASIQIGLSRRIGWQVPERYELPLLSQNPMEFWRRWNTYVRVWLEAYVFLPMATGVARRSRRRAAQVVVAFAVLAASGLLHDGYVFAARFTASTRMTRMFLAAGLAALVWRLMGGLAAALRARLRGATRSWWDGATTVVSHVFMALALAAAGAVWWS